MRPVERIEQAMLNAGVQPHRVKSTIARICGIQAPSVHQWFSGRTQQPKAEHLAALADTYGLSLHWVVTGKGQRQSINAASESESLLLELYRSLPPDLQAIARRQIAALAPPFSGQEESE